MVPKKAARAGVHVKWFQTAMDNAHWSRTHRYTVALKAWENAQLSAFSSSNKSIHIILPHMVSTYKTQPALTNQSGFNFRKRY